MSDNLKICFIVSTINTVRAFLDNHIRLLSESFDVYIVANVTENDFDYLQNLPIKGYKHIAIERQINLTSDLKSVFQLTNYFRLKDFFVVHSVTPKAGLVTALAGRIAGVKNRIHIFTGQVWVSRKGLMRIMLMSIDKLITILDTHILVDGYSQRDFLIYKKLISTKKSIVLANGSIAGVDTVRFSPNKDIRNDIRSSLGISIDKIVFIFLGRLCNDKGLDELLSAFSMLSRNHRNAYLLLVGLDEENYATIIKRDFPNLRLNENICLFGLTKTPEYVLNAGDVFCLPSHREGFGMSVIEAAAMGLPTIVSDTYGLRDSTIPGETGLICKVGDAMSLYNQMNYFLNHKEEIEVMGKRGLEYVNKNFNNKLVEQAWLDFYHDLVKS